MGRHKGQKEGAILSGGSLSAYRNSRMRERESIMTYEEFMRQFDSDPYELIVRISWCWTKKSGPFSETGGQFHAKARFDRAIDTRTDEVIGAGLYNWLEWLTPRHRIGHPYGLAFESGHLYRILVRESSANDTGMCRRYLVEHIVESEVEEPRLDPIWEFESQYHAEEIDRYLLIEDNAYGWANAFGYRRAQVRYLAVAHGESDRPIPCLNHLAWMEKGGEGGLRTTFSKLGVYRAVVRQGRKDPASLMLVRVIGRARGTDASRFDAIRDEYTKPVIIERALGKFTLNRRYDWYEGTIDYLGQECDVLLSVDEGTTDTGRAIESLERLCGDLRSVDRQVREYASAELLTNACDWCDEELTPEQFMERMSNPSITIGTDGSIEFMFDDGDMFWGHAIVVWMGADGICRRADIEG